jgi:hypothetical protein
MMRKVFRASLIVLFSALCSFVIGCSEAGPEFNPVENQVDIPDQFSEGSDTWDRVEVQSASDTECLLRFFAMHNDLAGSPDMEGEPVVFQSGGTDRLFYWRNTTVDGLEWKCVRFERGKFFFTEGTESPFK